MSELLDSVSRETIERLRTLETVVRKWTVKINLISRDSVNALWERHILDSLQLYRAAPAGFEKWVDIGTGGGFPGLVVAILALELPARPQITLVDSDARKCAFLRAALRETGATATVLNGRIEEIDRQNADILSARALADLDTLLGFAERHLAPAGTALFAKGAKWRSELEIAKSRWNFDYDVVKSAIEADAVILNVSGVSRV